MPRTALKYLLSCLILTLVIWCIYSALFGEVGDRSIDGNLDERRQSGREQMR